jgi:hypothetical protein
MGPRVDAVHELGEFGLSFTSGALNGRISDLASASQRVAADIVF